MSLVPTPPTFDDGVLDSSKLNQLADAIEFVQNPPRAELRQTVVQSIPNNTVTALLFDVADLDTNVTAESQHDTTTNTSRFTCVYPGLYLLGGGPSFASNSSGVRLARWTVNGTTVNGSEVELTATSAAVSLLPARAGIKVPLNVGDYVELCAFQNSGGALNTSVTTGAQSRMSVLWVSN